MKILDVEGRYWSPFIIRRGYKNDVSDTSHAFGCLIRDCSSCVCVRVFELSIGDSSASLLVIHAQKNLFLVGLLIVWASEQWGGSKCERRACSSPNTLAVSGWNLTEPALHTV